MAYPRSFRISVFLSLLLCILLFNSSAFADSYVRIVRLSDMSGNVEIDRNSGKGFEKAILNMPITQGVRLRTGNDGRAEVEFENGSVVRLVGNSVVGFTQLSLRSSGERVNEIQIGNGTVYVDYRHKGGDLFRVGLADRSFDLEKDVRLRVRLGGGESDIAVFKGEVEVQSAKVKKNQTLTLDLNEPSKSELAKNVTPLRTDEYNQEREQYLRLASNRNYGSPYSYGYSDLNRYGAFFNMPGYGLVWQPIGMSMAWDPYSNGYWSMYPGVGYTWVSGYPWGWLPYRYGNWAFAPGAGWFWVPGGWNTWNTGVAVYNPPTTWRPPVLPVQGGGGTVAVGHPLPPPTRIIHPDGMPIRPDRLDPVGRGTTVDTGAQPKTTTPTNSVTAPTANAVTRATQPDTRTAVQSPAVRPQMNKATRDFETRMQRSERMQPMPGMHPGVSSRSVASPGAVAAPSSQPHQPASAPAPAPAPRMSEPRMPPHKTNPNPR